MPSLAVLLASSSRHDYNNIFQVFDMSVARSFTVIGQNFHDLHEYSHQISLVCVFLCFLEGFYCMSGKQGHLHSNSTCT